MWRWTRATAYRSPDEPVDCSTHPHFSGLRMTLTVEQFLDRVRDEFAIDRNASLGSELIDIGLDSLAVLELVMFVEGLLETESAPMIVDFPILATLSDAYSLYVRLSSLKQVELRSRD